MIFDSSIWINYSKGVINQETDLLDTQLSKNIAPFICPPIVQEVLQGIRIDWEYQKMKETLFQVEFLNLDPYFVADESAKIYRGLRKKGVTINKPNDCLIAFYAIHFKLPLVHNDNDFNKIAKHTSLKIYNK